VRSTSPIQKVLTHDATKNMSIQETKLTLEHLRAALSGSAAAIRCITELAPAGGPTAKVYPPTYEGGTYATEGPEYQDGPQLDKDGKTRKELTRFRRVSLDSVQAQANRFEQALLRGHRLGKLEFPLLVVDFGRVGLPEVGEVTALDAPHRIADAILRDSIVERSGKPFRHRNADESSEEGLRFEEARINNATPLFELCPTALIFGTWDSTGPKGGLGAKFARALVSEIVAYDCEPGVRASSRIDPLGIEKESAEIYAKKGGGYTLDAELAEKKSGKPVLYGKEGKPSEINHGNVTPSIRDKNKNLNHGGMIIARATQTTVLSLPALRRLRFPVGKDRKTSPEIDLAAQTTLVALALCAITWQQDEGYDLRSRCLLDGKPGAIEIVQHGEAKPFTLDAEAAAGLLKAAAADAKKLGLPWPTESIVLVPSADLKTLVVKSREKAAAAPVAEV